MVTQKPLKIAVDARPLGQQLTGISRYLQQLLIRLIPATQNQVNWYLYSDAPLEFSKGYTNVHCRIRSKRSGRLQSTPIAQYQFPLWVKRDNIDLFWSPRHHLPLLLPRSVKKVVTIHDLVWKEAPETMMKGGYLVERFFMPPAIRAADRIIAVSEATKCALYKYFPSSMLKTKVISEAACLAESQGLGGLESDNGEIPPNPYFLFVGTLEPRKNLKRLLAAFAQVRCSHQLVIVGGHGWGKDNIYKMILEHNLQQRVSVRGYVTDASLQRLYQRACALLMPSLYEGFGLPLLEAMSWGVPVLTGNGSSMPEVAGDAGIFVDPSSVPSIAQGLQQLANNIELRHRLAKNALIRAKQYSWEKAARDTMSLFFEVAGISPCSFPVKFCKG